MTSKPFGVNLTVLPTINPPPYGEYAQIILDEGIKIVETAGLVKDYVPKFKEAGCTVLHKCTTIRHSLSAIKMGVDFLSIDGFECAGHVGEHDIPNFVLVSRAREQLGGVPFIASGGMANGRSLAAAMALGACGINMGTRFMCTVEAPIHHNIKQAIVDADENDTDLLLRRWKNTARYFKNSVTQAAGKIEKESKTGKFEEIADYVSGKRGRQVFLNGDPDYGVSRPIVCCVERKLTLIVQVWTAGICIGLIHDIPTCDELVKRIETEARDALQEQMSLYKEDAKL